MSDAEERLAKVIDQARAIVDNMSEADRLIMEHNQTMSYVRSLRPCEHHIRDWETCEECRSKALSSTGDQS